MAFLDQIDLTGGSLPPWLAPLISLTRPLATTLTGMLVPVGAFTCGTVALFDAQRGLDMAAASTAFLAGIPDSLYLLIGGVFGAYSASKTVEAIKAPAPAGGHSAESPPVAPEAAPAATEVASESNDHLAAMMRRSARREEAYVPTSQLRRFTLPDSAPIMRRVMGFLSDQARTLIHAGVSRDRICIDPGPGFGKSANEDIVIQRETAKMASLGYPLMCAVWSSRLAAASMDPFPRGYQGSMMES